MLAMEMEDTYSDYSKYCPCSICVKKDSCIDECLRFNEYVGTTSVALREKRWSNFKNLGGNPI